MERAEKRKTQDKKKKVMDISPVKGRLRGSFPTCSMDDMEIFFFFCDQLVDEDFHKASTMNLDAKVTKDGH